MDGIKEIFDALSARIKSPILGSILFSYLVINWKPVFYLLFSGENIVNKFTYFEAHTIWYSTFLFPTVFGVLIACLSPWVSYFGAYVVAKPVSLARMLQVEEENKRLLAEQGLAQARNDLLSTQIDEVIDQAEQFEKVDKIEDAEIRLNLQRQIDDLSESLKEKKEPDRISTINMPDRDSAEKKDYGIYHGGGWESPKIKLSNEAEEMLAKAATSKNGEIIRLQTLSGTHFSAGDYEFKNQGVARSLAVLESAVEELEKYGFIRAIGTKREIFRLTDKGYSRADGIDRLTNLTP